jgi:3-phenylpropionate/trans-cinnamate dioxygenase ferredoxin subunit
MTEQWIRAMKADDLDAADVARFDHESATYALYRDEAGRLAATDGLCTHSRVHLADGFVFGTQIECPKHNGRFDIHTGEAKGAPVCVNLATHAVRVDAEGWIEILVS